MLNDPASARLALLALYVEDTFGALGDDARGNPDPPPDPRILADWVVDGTITGRDALFDTQSLGLGDRVFYGFLLHAKADPGAFAAVIRGTAGLIEWIEDGQFLSIPHPLAGMVENGFYSIYGSLEYRAADATVAPVALAEGVARAVGTNRVTVVGHSLGSALGTYLTLDLAVREQLGERADACLFASPHTGNKEFVDYFDRQVARYRVFNYELDAVPKVPLLSGYAALPRVQSFGPFEAQARIRLNLGCNHHAVCYAAMLDYQAADWKGMPQVDQQRAQCILGSAQG
jgi:triacylglycerol lipase